MEKEERNCICRTCKYHAYEKIDRGYVCCSSDSDYCGDWTDDDDWCGAWEEKTE